MKNIIVLLVVLFAPLPVFADTVIKLEGTGTTKCAVKSFNKSVIDNGGKVDKNTQTRNSSFAEFDDVLFFVVIMSSEVVGKNKVNIHMVVKLPNPDYMSYITVQPKIEADISKKIRDSMKQYGYY